jgi:hypothetical protein
VEMARPITRCLRKRLEETIENFVDIPTQLYIGGV